MPSDRELDHLIDAALSSYSATEAQPGLEQRILTNALAESPRRRRFAWAWTLAVPTAACLLVFLFFAGWHNSHRKTLEATSTTAPTTSVASPSETPATSFIPSPLKRSTQRKVSAQLSANRETLPKQEVFPSPSPLTAEEQSLIAYNAAQLRATSTGPGTQLDINSLIISELQITPLDIPALDLPASKASEFSRNEQP